MVWFWRNLAQMSTWPRGLDKWRNRGFPDHFEALSAKNGPEKGRKWCFDPFIILAARCLSREILMIECTRHQILSFQNRSFQSFAEPRNRMFDQEAKFWLQIRATNFLSKTSNPQFVRLCPPGIPNTENLSKTSTSQTRERASFGQSSERRAGTGWPHI